MATPTNSQKVSTPKNPLALTPNRPTASPRPNTGNLLNRPFSHKSPAVKTPASTHGHTHRVSVSSHPMSTPLAAPVLSDDLLNINSPAAALIASLGPTGLTPLPSGQDGLGIMSGINPIPIRDIHVPKNPEVERLQRVQEVVHLLKARTIGRGITRDGVERLAQLQGFTTLWDDNNLTIAGNIVDLEIIFGTVDKDAVQDVVLNLNSGQSEEPQLKKTASMVVKGHLTQSIAALEDGAWKGLREFSQDLQYLSEHDHIEDSTNCFELLDKLYQTFCQIWDEEKKRMKEYHEVQHVCQGNVGKPGMDAARTLGTSATYWLDQHEFLARAYDEKSTLDSKFGKWTAIFSCEKGEPYMTSNGNWLAPTTLASSTTTEEVFQDIDIEKPNWQDQPHLQNVGVDTNATGVGGMDIDKSLDHVQDTLQLHLLCHLDPAVLIPINVFNELNAQSNLIRIDESKVLTYHQALQAHLQPGSIAGQVNNQDVRWRRTLVTFSKTGMQQNQEHAYMLSSQGGAWCLPTTELRLIHPREFAECLSILRQYALLWTLLRTIVKDSPDGMQEKDSGKIGPPVRKTVSSDGVTTRSNRKVTEAQLEQVLRDDEQVDHVLNVDISMDIVSDITTAKLSIIVPIRQHSFIEVMLDVKRNGILAVSSIQGLPSINSDKIKNTATKVLKLSEDIGVLIHWLLEQARKEG